MASPLFDSPDIQIIEDKQLFASSPTFGGSESSFFFRDITVFFSGYLRFMPPWYLKSFSNPTISRKKHMCDNSAASDRQAPHTLPTHPRNRQDVFPTYWHFFFASGQTTIVWAKTSNGLASPPRGSVEARKKPYVFVLSWCASLAGHRDVTIRLKKQTSPMGFPTRQN